MGGDLLDELRAISLSLREVRWLVALGVPQDVVLALHGNGDLAAANVTLGGSASGSGAVGSGGRFEWGGPDRRLILAARDVHGDVADLVALASHNEREWALRLGAADFLGVEWLWHAQAHAPSGAGREPSGSLGSRDRGRDGRSALRSAGRGPELRLYSNPLGWLRGRCEGVCVLDWTASAVSALRGLGPRVTLVCDPGAKARLSAVLAHGGLPLVAESQTKRIAA